MRVDGGVATVNGLAPAVRYDRATIVLHWATAGLVVLLWAIAQGIDLFPVGAPKIAARSLHILLGVALAVVLLTRMSWRLSSGQRLPPSDPGLAGDLSKAVHHTLYIVLTMTVALGIANAWIRGDTITGLFTIPQYAPGDKALKSLVEHLHGTCANFILIMAGLHAAAALIHHFVLHDNVLRRMLPKGEST